jgi:NAD(P)-dependent dehydrogenase (short-subunit alcohol dehydrogenase family)
VVTTYLELKGKVPVVTGGSVGIGLAMAQELARPARWHFVEDSFLDLA